MKLNNRALRGIIYTTQGVGAVLVGAFATWEHTPPLNKYSIALVVTSAIMGGIAALRAYIDQHLSRYPSTENENKLQVETTTTSGTEVAKEI